MQKRIANVQAARDMNRARLLSKTCFLRTSPPHASAWWRLSRGGLVAFAIALVLAESGVASAQILGGDGTVELTGESRVWDTMTVTLSGPAAKENGGVGDNAEPNPFLDFRFSVVFSHDASGTRYERPGYFAVDARGAESEETQGNRWVATFRPDRPGDWGWKIRFLSGPGCAVAEGEALKTAKPLAPYDGLGGEFVVEAGDWRLPDLRARGRLEYVGEPYLRYAGDQSWFLKGGPDAPETLLAFQDFDGTRANNVKKGPLKAYAAHTKDWREGDPVWKGGKGKGLIGAINYLAEQGCNTISFLPYNAGGDGDNVWPFLERDDPLHYDVSKLAQWEVVFEHAQRRGLHLHFKLQETEMDDERRGQKADQDGEGVPTALDGGKLGTERKLYLRELIARFGHHLALTWNLGEENTQSPEEQREMARFLAETDPYPRNIVIHTYPNQQDKVYPALLGDQSQLTGASLQNPWNAVHRRTRQWREASEKAGRPWVVANDEQNPAGLGVPPDPGYKGHDGIAVEKKKGKKAAPGYDLHDIRRQTLWGNLMAGGSGVEYYFGYQLPENDLLCEDFRSRHRSWGFIGVALNFFSTELAEVPLPDLRNADALVGNPSHGAKGPWAFTKPGELYLIYLPSGGEAKLDLGAAGGGDFTVSWFDPRQGGGLQKGETSQVSGGGTVSLGSPPDEPAQDWLVVVRRAAAP